MQQPTERTPQQHLSLFFLIWTGCFLLFNLLSQGVLMACLGKDAYQEFISGENFTERGIEIVRYLQILLPIGIFGIPPLAYAALTKQHAASFLKINRFPDYRLAGLTVLVAGFSLPVAAWALQVNQGFNLPSVFGPFESYLREMEGQNEKFLEAILKMDSNFDFAVNFLMIAIIPPVVEELLFRGTLQQLLQKQAGPHLAILFTGMFFSFIHMEFSGFLPRMMLGILFGYLFLWSGSLWVTIFAHFLHNGIQVALVFLFQRNVIQADIEHMESFPPYVTVGATVLLFLTLSIFERAARKQQPPNDGERLGEGVLDK